MKRLIYLLPLAVLAFTNARAELGHKFPPIKPEELAKIQAALPKATVKPAKPRKLLVFFLTEGYVHGSIPYCNEAIKEIGEKTGAYTVDFSEDMGVFTPENLKQYDAVLFNNTTGLKFVDMAARQALIDYVHSGKGVAGIHSATDNFPTWEAGQALLGGKFDGHPWGAGDTEAIKIDDPKHPIVAAFGGKGFWVNDEIYQMRAPYDRSQVRVLLSLDMSKPQNARDPQKLKRTDNDFPICWIKQVDGGGRVFYCSFGHNSSMYWTPQILQTYLNGIQYALGDFPADATPSGKLSPQPEAALAPETPEALNPHPSNKPPTTTPAPAAPKPAAIIHGRIPAFVSLITMAELAATTDAPAGDPLANGLKALSAYDYGSERTDIVAFDDYIRSQSPEGRAKIEAALLPLLSQPGTSPGAKDWICRTLIIAGSNASVPVLEKLTSDPKLSHLAVYALFCMGTPEAKSALIESLGSTPAPLRPAVIGAIGRLGIAEAVPKLAEIAALDDKAQATAALDALAAIGTDRSLATLRKVSVPAPLEITCQWALIHAAFHVLKANPSDQEAPKAVFASLTKPGFASALRVAAAKGLIQADPAGSWAVVSNLLKDDDAKVRLDVAKLTPQLPADAVTSLATALPSLDPAVQMVVVDYFAQTQNASAETILKQALASTNPDVHLAGITGYGTANLATSASVLLPYLSKSPDEVTAAEASLGKLSSPDATAALKAAAAAAQGATQAALLLVFSERGDAFATEIAFAATSNADPAVAEAAFEAIGKLAAPNDFPRIVALVPQAKTDSERKNLEKALIFTAIKYPDKDKATDTIVAALNGASTDTRQTLIAGLASIESPKAVAGLEAQLGAPSVDDRKIVIRALSATHTPQADTLLLEAATKGSETSEKVLALRGFLDSIHAQKLGGSKLIDAYKTAWPLAVRQEEKDAILAGLKNMKNKDADKLIEQLNPPTTQTKSASN